MKTPGDIEGALHVKRHAASRMASPPTQWMAPVPAESVACALPCALQARPRENHHANDSHRAHPPSKILLLAEGRAVWEAGATLALWPLLQLAPRGDGHAVIVLPGLGASDGSTEMLRKFLETRGYTVHGWGLGANCGPLPGVEKGLLGLLRRLHESSGKVSLVGWSLGGVFARMLASRSPESVRGVVTLGSPLHGSPKATRRPPRCTSC